MNTATTTQPIVPKPSRAKVREVNGHDVRFVPADPEHIPASFAQCGRKPSVIEVHGTPVAYIYCGGKAYGDPLLPMWYDVVFASGIAMRMEGFRREDVVAQMLADHYDDMFPPAPADERAAIVTDEFGDSITYQPPRTFVVRAVVTGQHMSWTCTFVAYGTTIEQAVATFENADPRDRAVTRVLSYHDVGMPHADTDIDNDVVLVSCIARDD